MDVVFLVAFHDEPWEFTRPGETFHRKGPGSASCAAPYPRAPGVPGCVREDLGPVGPPVGESRPQLQDRLGVDLTHPALGHPEDLAYLCEGQTFVVVKREDRLLAITQLGDGLGEDLLGLLVLEDRDRSCGRVWDRVTESGALRAIPS